MVFGPAGDLRFLGSGRLRRPPKPFQKVGGFARVLDRPGSWVCYRAPALSGAQVYGIPGSDFVLCSVYLEVVCPRPRYTSKGSQSVLFGQVFFGGLGYQGQTPHMFRKRVVFWPCRRRLQGQHTILFMNMCGFLALVPQASKNNLTNKPIWEWYTWAFNT